MFPGVVWICHDYKKLLAEVCLNIYEGVGKVDAIFIVLTVLCNSAALVVEFAVVFVLLNSLWEVLCFSNVGGMELNIQCPALFV